MSENTKTNVPENPYLTPLAIMVAGAFIAAAIFFTNSSDQPSTTVLDDTQAQSGSPEQAAPTDFSFDLEEWPYLGRADAPVTIVEYSDFSCPFCARFWAETLPSIKRDYIDTGQVRFVYKDFPVVGGDRAAEAAHCASEQDKFWEYHDLLFQNHAQDRGQWNSVGIHRSYAGQLGMNVNALISCFEERRYQEKVSASSQEARNNGARGTPYFLVNNQPIYGARPYSDFQSAIEEALGNP